MSSNVVAPGFQTGSNGRLMANGKPFLIKGINWWGTEGPTRTFGGLKQRSMNGILDFIQEHEFNAIRILVSHRSVMINGKLPASEYDEGRTPELVNLRYLDQIELMLQKAAERRLLVLVNAHRTVPDAWPGKGLWYDEAVREAEVIATWISLAKLLCKHWNVFAVDLANEPRKASWGRGMPSDWNRAAERIGNAVLGVCPRLLIFVQGVAGSPGAQGDGGVEQGYFWGENLYGVHTAPVRLRDQSKLVYSPHTYGPGTVKQQAYFPTCAGGGCGKAAGFPGNMPDIWDRHFGFVAEQTKHAVVVGEFGGFYTGHDRQWQDMFVDYLAHRGFGAFYFGLNPDSDDTGGLLRHDWRGEETSKLALIARMQGTRVTSIIGEEAPLPDPPRPPPSPSPTSPPPLISSGLLDLFTDSPPPPPRVFMRPPPPPYLARQSDRVVSGPKPVILGAPVIHNAPARNYGQPAGDGGASDATAATNVILVILLPLVLVTAVLRYNPGLAAHARERLGMPPSIQRVVRAGRKVPAGVALGTVRPRPRGSTYDPVAIEPQLTDPEDAETGEPQPPTAPSARPSRCGHTAPSAAREPSPSQSESKPRRSSTSSPAAQHFEASDPDGEQCGERLKGTAPTRQGKSRQSAAAQEVDSPQQAAPQTGGSAPYTPGMQVRIMGLKNAREHNGKEGVLISPIETPAGKRWNLRLLSGDLLAIKEGNMQVSGIAPSIQAMVAALERAGEHDKAAMLRSVLPDRS